MVHDFEQQLAEVRALAVGADRDASEAVSLLRSHTRLLQALHDNQAIANERLGLIDSRLDAMTKSQDHFADTLLGMQATLIQHSERFKRVEGRLEGVDGRLTGVDGRLGRVDGRLEGVDGRLAGVESEVGDVKVIVRALAQHAGIDPDGLKN